MTNTINPAYIVNVYMHNDQEYVLYLNPHFEQGIFETMCINTQTGQGSVQLISPIDRPFDQLVSSVRSKFADTTLAHLAQYPQGV